MGDVGGGGVAAGGGGGGSGGSDGRDGSGGGGNGVGTHSCFPLAWRTHGGGSWRVQGRLPGAAAFPQFVQVRVVGSNRSLHVRSIPVTALRIWVDRRNACVSVSTKASKLPTLETCTRSVSLRGRDGGPRLAWLESASALFLVAARRTGCCGSGQAREVASSWRAVQPAEACKHLLRSRGTVATRQPDEHSQKALATSRLPNTSRTRSSRRLETLADLLCSPLTYSPVRTLKRSRTNAFVRRLATPVGCWASPVREGWMRTRPA